jgi:hypothetical protein
VRGRGMAQPARGRAAPARPADAGPAHRLAAAAVRACGTPRAVMHLSGLSCTGIVCDSLTAHNPSPRPNWSTLPYRRITVYDRLTAPWQNPPPPSPRHGPALSRPKKRVAPACSAASGRACPSWREKGVRLSLVHPSFHTKFD